jgi:hypothetical protein
VTTFRDNSSGCNSRVSELVSSYGVDIKWVHCHHGICTGVKLGLSC